MSLKDWHQRWEADQIFFHRDAVNPNLERHWPALDVEPDETVLVPLCGKSVDMTWFKDQGLNVVGVEISPIAANAYFTEAGVVPHTRMDQLFEVFEYDRVRIYCGDFFALRDRHLARVTAVWDRGSMVALGPEERKRYVKTLRTELESGTRILLATVDYDQTEMSGPPYSVTEEEVRELYAGAAAIDQLERNDILEVEARFRERGVTAMHEAVYRITL